MGWRDFCIGGIAGATLSLSRPPAGISIEEWISPSGARQALWRGAALTVIGAALLCRPRPSAGTRLPAIELSLGAAAGFALHGFVLGDMFSIDSQAAWLIALTIAMFLMIALRGKSAPDVEVERGESNPRILRLWMALSGAGLSLVLAALNSRACLLGAGSRDDDTVSGAVALALTALGALAFGPLLGTRRRNRSLFPIGLAVAAVLAWLSFGFLKALGNPNGFDKLMQSFGLDSGLRGTFVYDALIAARVFALPALCAGAAFSAAGAVADIACALLGAAVASILAVSFGHFDAEAIDVVAMRASERANWGIVLTAFGALGASNMDPIALRWRIARATLPLGCLAFGLWNRPSPALPLSPWEKLSPRVEWIRETPEGLLTIEFQTNRGRIVTLDRRRLTPTTEELEGDASRIQRSLDGLPPDRSAVLAGVLTPERAFVLRSQGIANISVEVPWPELELELEVKLFELSAANLPAERTAAGADTRRSHEQGNASRVVIAPPVESPSRTFSGLETASTVGGRTCIGWLSAQQEIAQLDWGERVLVSCGHLENLAIGIVRGAAQPALESSAGKPRASRAWERLARIDGTQREFDARSRAAERLMRAADQPVMTALRRLCIAQRPSSPFETRAQRTELDAAAIELLLQSGLAAEPRGFERELDEFVATTLKGKRELEGLVAFARPLADAHATWACMQRAAAAADWEFMQWPQAARRLEQLHRACPDDLQVRFWLAEALLRADEFKAALITADELLAIQPGRLEVEKIRAIAALRAGDSRGREWLDILLREHPNDAELAPYAKKGQLPPLWPSLGIPGEVGASEEH